MKFCRRLLTACIGASMFWSVANAQQQPDSSIASSQGSGSAGSAAAQNPLTLKTVKTNGGTANFLPLWTNATTVGNSALFQSSTGLVGLGTTTPAQGLDLGNNNNMVIRVDPGNDSTQAIGGYSLVGRGPKGVPNTWWTLSAAVGGGFGVPVNSYSIWQYPPNSIPGCCLNRLTILPAEASTDTGGTVTIDQDANISQPRTAGGMAKAMVFVSPTLGILQCFNSALSAAAATKPPCGFSFFNIQEGITILDFGFRIDDRFLSVTASADKLNATASLCTDTAGACIYPPPTQSQVQAFTVDYNGYANVRYWLIVY